MSRTPETAGLSYVDDTEYDLYVTRPKNCPSENDIVQPTVTTMPPMAPCLNGFQGPRGCVCNNGYDSFDCSIPTCTSMQAPRCDNGECIRINNKFDKTQPSFECRCGKDTEYNETDDECQPIQEKQSSEISNDFQCGIHMKNLNLLENVGSVTLEDKCGTVEWDDETKYWRWEEDRVIMECLQPR